MQALRNRYGSGHTAAPCGSCSTSYSTCAQPLHPRRCRTLVWGVRRTPGGQQSPEAAGGSSQHLAPSAPKQQASSAPKQQRSKKPKPVQEYVDKAQEAILKQQGACYGCGAPLQIEVPGSAGYVAPDKYALKKRYRQLNQVLCERCSGLCNGAMIPAVEDFTQKMLRQQQQQQQVQQQGQPGTDTAASSSRAVATVADSTAAATAATPGEQDVPVALLGKLLISPEELKERLLEVRSRKALVVLLVDLLDASGTLMSKVRDIVGKNPIVLVGTKMDLLPEGCRPKDVADWLLQAALRKRLNVTSAHLVSSHTGEGIAVATARVCKERKGRDVFVVGAANVGKSAFVRAMLSEMSSFQGDNFDPAAMANARYLPVESAMPGTTLGLIPLQAFETGGTLYDTPGVHLHHRIPHMLTPAEVKLLHPRRQLKPYVPETPAEIMQEEDEEEEAGSSSAAGPGRGSTSSSKEVVAASYLWSGLVRLDVLSGPASTAVVFYGPASMRVYGLPLLEEGQTVDFDSDLVEEDNDSSGSKDADGADSNSSSSKAKAAKVLTASRSVAARGGLVPHDLVVKSPLPMRGCLADVAVSGVPGWVSFYAPYYKGQIQLRVWAPRGVEVFLRPPLPTADPLKLVSDTENVQEALQTVQMEEMWEAYKQGLDLQALGLEGEEEAVKQVLFGSGVPLEEQTEWYEAAASEDADEDSRTPEMAAIAEAVSEQQLQRFVDGVTIPWGGPGDEEDDIFRSSSSGAGRKGRSKRRSAASSRSGRGGVSARGR